jgi:hypothetical protein|tara:strand:- start:30 stop:206 length:177 start_codon:yes stop_codon:yes gene_type:complete
MIKYLKKLWKKLFGQASATLPENVGEKIVKLTPKPKPSHCNNHNRFKKSCPNCQEAIK